MNLTWLELSACSLLALLKTDDGLTYEVRLAFVIPSFVTVLKITREGFVIEFGTENAEECEEAITQPLIDSACNDIQFYLRFCTSVYITKRNAPVLQTTYNEDILQQHEFSTHQSLNAFVSICFRKFLKVSKVRT